MKLSELWDKCKTYQEKASDNSRTQAFTAVGIAWLFSEEGTQLSTGLSWVIGLVAVFFVCDVLHYYVGATVMRNWIEKKEKQATEQGTELHSDLDFQQPKKLDRWPRIFFRSKFALLLLAYLVLGIDLAIRHASTGGEEVIQAPTPPPPSRAVGGGGF